MRLDHFYGPTILLEGQDYFGMFAKLIAARDEMFAAASRDPMVSSESMVRTAIADAKRVLKKSDRIVWYLKVYRQLSATHWLGAEKAAELGYNSPATVPEQPPRAILNDLEHYISLPIPKIQNYQFRNQSVTEVLSYFRECEEEWKRETKGAFEDDSEVIIAFPDGWVWVNTGKAYCDKESEAMGHCGNSPRKYSGDKLLSLREPKHRGNQKLWLPHLTFILDKDGNLTEMKGRGNDKPAPKYHDKIIELLKHPLIKGLKGGGYMAENNFSLNDLPYEKRKEVVAAKPELGTCLDAFYAYGWREPTMDALRRDFDAVLERYNFNNYDRAHVTGKGFRLEGKRLTVEHRSSINEFVFETGSGRVGLRLTDIVQLAFGGTYVTIGSHAPSYEAIKDYLGRHGRDLSELEGNFWKLDDNDPPHAYSNLVKDNQEDFEILTKQALKAGQEVAREYAMVALPSIVGALPGFEVEWDFDNNSVSFHTDRAKFLRLVADEKEGRTSGDYVLSELIRQDTCAVWMPLTERSQLGLAPEDHPVHRDRLKAMGIKVHDTIIETFLKLLREHLQGN